MSIATQEMTVDGGAVGVTDAELMSREEVGAFFRISEAGVARWQTRGWLPKPLRIGRKPLWRRQDIMALVEQAAAAAK